MSGKIGINGFGRIGRAVLRQLYDEAASSSNPPKVAAINDLTDPETLAHLLKYDSLHGTFPQKIEVKNNSLIIGDQEIRVYSERDPSNIPWGDVGADIVLECTGIFRSREKAAQHLSAGAKKVIVSAPSPDPDNTIAYGINHETYSASQDIISCASCTTNSLAPLAKVILDNFGMSYGSMTTIHSYTNDQSLLDSPHKDLRRARAAAVSMIPTTTGAAKAVGLVLPELKGKLDGFAVRVPTSNVSLIDLVVRTDKDVSVQEANRALKSASENQLKNILGYSDEPLVSVDFNGSLFSSTVDAQSTMVIQDRLLKVVGWYDNEMGFSARMIDTAKMLLSKL